MAQGEHQYTTRVEWTGNRGEGTSGYRSYDRVHQISAPDKPVIPGSSDPAFRGDRTRYNPEDLLVASLSACHMLWYLHLCADAGVTVTSYVDDAVGTMVESEENGGHFTEVILRPSVTVQVEANIKLAGELHDRAHHLCFVANSVNFPVRCDAQVKVEPAVTP